MWFRRRTAGAVRKRECCIFPEYVSIPGLKTDVHSNRDVTADKQQ